MIVEDLLAILEVSRAVGGFESGWLFFLAKARPHRRVAIAERTNIGCHRDHLRTLHGKSAPIHTTRQAFIDAVFDVALRSSPWREFRKVSGRRQETQGARFHSRTQMTGAAIQSAAGEALIRIGIMRTQ